MSSTETEMEITHIPMEEIWADADFNCRGVINAIDVRRRSLNNFSQGGGISCNPIRRTRDGVRIVIVARIQSSFFCWRFFVFDRDLNFD